MFIALSSAYIRTTHVEAKLASCITLIPIASQHDLAHMCNLISREVTKTKFIARTRPPMA
jgi:hypothetical protein